MIFHEITTSEPNNFIENLVTGFQLNACERYVMDRKQNVQTCHMHFAFPTQTLVRKVIFSLLSDHAHLKYSYQQNKYNTDI